VEDAQPQGLGISLLTLSLGFVFFKIRRFCLKRKQQEGCSPFPYPIQPLVIRLGDISRPKIFIQTKLQPEKASQLSWDSDQRREEPGLKGSLYLTRNLRN
jgi:hypothetical protein